MHVKTNQLGPIEKLINRQGWTNRKSVLAAFVLALDSAVIWNVPAVHCTQKNCCLSQTWSWHRTEWKRSTGPRSLGYCWRPLGRNWWTGVEEYSNRLALTLSPVCIWKELRYILVYAGAVYVCVFVYACVCVCMCILAVGCKCVSNFWVELPDIQGSTLRSMCKYSREKNSVIFTHMYTHSGCSPIRLLVQCKRPYNLSIIDNGMPFEVKLI